jgi:uncharacterized membrane protein (DUF4010 family)
MESADATTLAIALATGVIIGLERGWERVSRDDNGPGLRTFALAALAGGLAGVQGSEPMALLIFLLLGAITVSGYIMAGRSVAVPGYTTECALIITFILGLLATRGQPQLAIAAAVVTALVLGLKPEIHGVLRQIQRLELLSTLQLLVVAAVVLPLLPDRDIWIEGLNLHLIGWFVLLILGLSWLGYVSLRLFGQRLGILLTALLGGMTSSTAVTATFSRRAATEHALVPALRTGIIIACSIMPIRVAVLVYVINPSLLTLVLPGLLALVLLPLIPALQSLLTMHATNTDKPLELGNPLDLKSAAIFATFLTTLFVVMPWLQLTFGEAGIYVASAISGLTDVDAISLTLARKSLDGLGMNAAALGIIIATASNTVVKAIIAAAFSARVLLRNTGALLFTAAILAALVQYLSS